MSRMRRLAAAVLMLAVAMLPVQSHAAGGYYSNEGYYEYSAPGWWGGPDTSGRVNVFEVDFDSRVGVDLFGCSGIGLFDFMKTTFNLNNITQQLKDSMKTILAKTLITTAMSVPQIASIFDTLNAFGNARFDIFKASCNMNDIRKDAMDMYVERCRSEGMSEVECQEKYTSQSKNLLAKVSDEVSEQLKNSQNANEAMRQIFCEDTSGKYNPSSNSCGIMNFLPQFQICIDSSVGGGCKGTYGKTDPALAWAGIANAGLMKIGGVMKTMDNITQQLDAQLFPMSSRKAAADCAYNKLQNGWEPADSPTAPEVSSRKSTNRIVVAQFTPVGFAGEEDEDKPDNTVQRYKDKLKGTCREEDPLLPVKALAACINEQNTGATVSIDNSMKVNIKDFINSEAGGIVRDQLNIDAKGAAEIIEHGTNCAIANTGATDPYIWLNMQNSAPDKRKATSQFFQVESNHWFKQSFVDFLQSELSAARVKVLNAELPEPSLKRLQKAIDDGSADAGDDADKQKALKDQRAYFETVLDQMKEEFEKIEQRENEKYTESKVARETRARMLQDEGAATRYIYNNY